MTIKLYEQNPYQTQFTAHVLSCCSGKAGWDIVLDQTAFYPEGGGQPFDLGTLDQVSVLAVHNQDGLIVHTCDGPLPVHTQVSGAIQWARRFDLMQHHSGEHIISGLAHQMYGCHNVGFHMGKDTITLDFDQELTEEQVCQLEQAVNQYIWEDHKVEVTYPSPEELASLTYRSKKALSGLIRIVTFPGADVCACCGTHVASSGQVGLVKLLSCQKFRTGVRIEALCGHRAYQLFGQLLAQNQTLSNLLSAKPLEITQSVSRLLARIDQLEQQLFHRENAYYSALARQFQGTQPVFVVEEGLSPDGLRRLCNAMLEVCSSRCASFSPDETHPHRLHYAIGQPQGDIRPLVQALNQRFHGRGGGKAAFAQGALQATPEEVFQFLQEYDLSCPTLDHTT